jgi:hypothetical protein
MNFWIWLREPAPSCNMHKSSTTCASMRVSQGHIVGCQGLICNLVFYFRDPDT